MDQFEVIQFSKAQITGFREAYNLSWLELTLGDFGVRLSFLVLKQSQVEVQICQESMRHSFNMGTL